MLLDVGSETYKRPSSLHGNGKPETIVEIVHNWKSKDPVKTSPFKAQSSHERIFVPASNVERAKEDGCMNKLKIERTYKLWQEDFKGRKNYNILSGVEQPESTWVNSFGNQAMMLSLTPVSKV